MDALTQRLPFAFPLLFAAMWLAISTVLAFLSNWFRLMARFPDQPESPLLRLTWQTGAMGAGVRMNNILTLSACPSGLRVGIMRVFGPFSRDFLVPWADITITRKASWSGPVCNLQFGTPAVGSLTISAYLANRLADAAVGRWPESGAIPEQLHHESGLRLLVRWTLVMGVLAMLIVLTTRFYAPPGTRPPIIAILIPAVVLGLGAIGTYLRERR